MILFQKSASQRLLITGLIDWLIDISLDFFQFYFHNMICYWV